MIALKLIILVSIGISVAQAALEAHRVTSLPDCGPLPTKWYSGYYNATTTKQLHFIYVESLSNPSTDPLVIWFTGGPGCSSFQGLFQENGPFIFADGEDYVKPNPYPQNVKANMLYIESPAGIGYSYAGTKEDTYHNDMSVTIDAFTVLKQFYQDYSELLPNDLFISGSSYGGIYAPYLSWQIHQYNLQAAMDPLNKTTKYNLKGFLVGNGGTDWDYDSYPTMPETMYNFNLITEQLYRSIVDNNCAFYFQNVKKSNSTQFCQDAWTELFNTTAGQGINIYDLFEKPKGRLALSSSVNRLGETIINGEKRPYKRGYTMSELTGFAYHPLLKQALGDEPVVGYPLSDYLNRQDVRDAFHIPDYIQPFEVCSSNMTYKLFLEGSQWIYPILMAYDYRMIHYSGNTDSMVSTLGTKKGIERQKFEVTNEWRQWFTDGEVSGFQIDYGNFKFATVHGAGHGAGQIKRKQVQQMVTNFIYNITIG